MAVEMTMPLPPDSGPRGTGPQPMPARDVAENGNPFRTLTDGAGRPLQSPEAQLSDAGIPLHPAFRGPTAGQSGMDPALTSSRAIVEVFRQSMDNTVRTLQHHVTASFQPHVQAAQETANLQRQAAHESLQAARAINQATRNNQTLNGGPQGNAEPSAPAGGPPARAGEAPHARRPFGALDDPSRREDRLDIQQHRLVPYSNEPRTPTVNARGIRVGDIQNEAEHRFATTPNFGAGRGLGIHGIIGPSSGQETGQLTGLVADRLKRVQLGPQLRQNDEGQYVVPGSGQVSLQRGVASTPDRLASSSEIRQFARGQAATGFVRGIGGRLEEGGFSGALPLGEAGIAVGVGQQALQFAQSQRESNRQYQAIEGGSNAQGFFERFHASRFALGQLGVMGGDQAKELYRGVTAAGYRGSERNDALRVATDQFKRNGTDIAQTLQLMSEAAKTGGKQLTGVSSALNQITDLAHKNGQNAEELRQSFIQNYTQRAQIYGSQGGTNAAISATNTAVTAGQGERFSGISNQGLNSEVGTRLQANRAGVQIGQFVQRAGSDPRFAAQAESNLTRSAASTALGTNRQLVESKLQEIRASGRQPTDEDYTRISQDLANSGGFDPFAASQIESAYGITGITGQNAAEYLVRQTAGAADPATKQQQQVTDSRTHAVDQSKLGHYHASADDAQKQRGGKLSWLKRHVTGLAPGGGRVADATEKGSAAQRYNDVVNQTGQVHPVVEQLLKSGLSQDTKVKVKSKGEDREVTLSDAIKYYSDQLDTGQVQIVSGNQKGQNVSQVTGGMGTQEDPNKAGSATDVKHQHGKAYNPKEGGGGGTVTITPSPILQQMFQFNGTGNVAITQGAQTGTAPGPVTPQQLPAGQGGH